MVKRKKEDFSNFMVSVLQNSMLTGIPQIASAGNAPKKIIRALVFVMCLVGFVYQSFLFMNMYWEYKTVIDVQVESPKVIDLPSMTACNYNGFSSSRICQDPKYGQECVNLTSQNTKEYWCKCFPRYCDRGADIPLLPKSKILKRMAYIPYEEYKPYLQTIEELVDYCTLVMADKKRMYYNCNTSNRVSIRCPTDNNFNMNVCYTLHSIMGMPNAVPQKVLSTGFSNMWLDPKVREYGTHLIRESIEVSFHSPRGIISPYEYGFSMHTATKNIFHLKKTVKHLLPPPYETQCHDYLADWKARGGWGPTTERECIEECKVNESMKAYGCISNMFISPSNKIRCEGIHNGGENTFDVTTNVIQCADEKCKPACYEESYQVVKDSMDSEDEPNCKDEWIGNRPNQKITVQVNFDGMETTTYSYSPKFQNIETFSYLGGYVGMWLGISLVAVFDFLETVVLMMKYPFRRYMLYKHKQQRITHIKKLQRDV